MGPKFRGITTLGVKGQVVIPAEVRKSLGLNNGDKLVVLSAPQDKGIMLVKAKVFDAMFENFGANFSELIKISEGVKGK